MPYITVVPAIRTIPGVEEFDYAIDDASDIQVGDVLLVPFRKQQLAALVIERKSESAFAARAIKLDSPVALLRLGSAAPQMLNATAQRTFTSLPTIFASWIRNVPKRIESLNPNKATLLLPTGNNNVASGLSAVPQRETLYAVRRWHDPARLLSVAKERTGKTLILTPWQHRADLLAKTLGVPVLHADIADGAAWKAVRDFSSSPSSVLVASRIGAWLGCVADTILVDEPENDDFKQDELSPRIDARWLVEKCAEVRPELSVISFATTPRLSSVNDEWTKAPTIELDLQTEVKQRRGSSSVESLTAAAYNEILHSVETRTPVTIIHPVVGDRARVACRDCGWTASCVSCGFSLTNIGSQGLCRKCGRKQPLPSECPSCGGLDLSRSSAGRDRLAEQCHSAFGTELVRVITLADLQTTALPRNGLVVITDLSLIGGVIEDTRRRERLLISWRRLAGVFASSGSRVVVQGSEEALTDARAWLTTEGVITTWKKEFAERKLFAFPPALRMAKILIDGNEKAAQALFKELESVTPGGWRLNGPFPVLFRAKTRKERWVVQLVTAAGVTDDALLTLLNPFKSRAIIDLDPIAFFA